MGSVNSAKNTISNGKMLYTEIESLKFLKSVCECAHEKNVS